MKRIVIIGLDSISYKWLKPLFSRNKLPNIKRLIEEGSFSLLKAPIVGATPHNWASISTGSTFKYHGCTWWVRAPKMTKPLYGFSSTTLMAEPIWAVASRAGVKSILFDVPQSYPVLWKNVIHVGEDGRPDSSYRCIQVSKGYLSEDLYEQYMKRAQLVADPLPNYYKILTKSHLVKIHVKKAENWKNISTENSYEAEIPIYLEGMKYIISEKSKRIIAKLCILTRFNHKAIELYYEKRADAKLGISNLGSWSKWVQHEFTVEGKRIKPLFRFKLLRLKNFGKSLHVYFSQIYPAENFTYPEELSKELITICGPYLQTSAAH